MLKNGHTPDVIAHNIKTMLDAGYHPRHAVAVAHSKARMSAMRTMKPSSPGQKPISFREGGLHAATHTPAGQPISAAKHAEAAAGKFGPKAVKEETFYRNVLKK